MRRILISKRGEFNYNENKSSSLGYAIKKLGTFFDGVEREENVIKESSIKIVTVSNNTLNSSADSMKNSV
ncbi:hypothetical protein [Flavobacterium sp.]|uniref:hypothetical protein n=1 Tax=Flavobacterium sp. TaxID=239 RepID=UPI0025BE3577|nr:hypothetical protein [Flavobacterium sp.]MBA4155744.1 hypothetical protein [Flavobacterium sp.]